MTVRDKVTDLLEGPDALHLGLTFESLVAAIVAPLLGAGQDPDDLRAALRRVVECDELWSVMTETVRLGEGVAESAADAVEAAERPEVLS